MYISQKESQIEAIVLSAESKPYDFNGNSGVSHKVRLSVSGEVIVCNSDEAQVKELQEYLGQTISVVVKVQTRKEVSKFIIESIVE